MLATRWLVILQTRGDRSSTALLDLGFLTSRRRRFGRTNAFICTSRRPAPHSSIGQGGRLAVITIHTIRRGGLDSGRRPNWLLP